MHTPNGRPERTRIPEWFIGGPRHGEIVPEGQPTHGGRYMVQSLVTPYHPDDLRRPEGMGEWAVQTSYYERQKLFLGRTLFVVWVADGIGVEDAVTRLVDILLPPHMLPGGKAASAVQS